MPGRFRGSLASILLLLLWSLACTHAPYGGDKESTLIVATAAHDVAKVQALLDSGANPNAMVSFDGLNQSPWRQVLQQLRPSHPEDTAILRAMLKAGANPAVAWGEGKALNITRLHNDEPLVIVMLHPNVDVVRALLDTGLKPRSGQFALVSAVESGDTEIAKLLVEAGVDVNGTGGGAMTPLIAAIERRDAKMMTYLEEHGARERP